MFKKLKAKLSQKRDRTVERELTDEEIQDRLAHLSQLTDKDIRREAAENVLNMVNGFGLLKPRPPADLNGVDLEKLAAYDYSTLPSSASIRLLEFSGKEVEFDDLKGRQRICRLVTYELDKAPPYLCLSYTWGSPVHRNDWNELYATKAEWALSSEMDSSADPSHWSKVMIGQNLNRALKQILSMKHECSHIWIDALCINQKDYEEKAIQIAMMTDIYAQAARTIVWLGEGGVLPRDLTAFWLLHEQVLEPLDKYVQEHGIESFSEGWDEETFHERLGIVARHCDWEGYAKFYRERTFFGRSWVFQEMAFSKDLLILIAHHVMSLDHMATLARFLRMSGLGLGLCSGNYRDDEHGDPILVSKLLSQSSQDLPSNVVERYPGSQIDNFHQIRRQVQGIGSETWLRDKAKELEIDDLEVAAYTFFAYMIDELRVADAKEPWDKIYAAYGFLKAGLAPLKLQPRFQLDYTKDITVFYMEITKLLLEITPELRVLCFKEPPSMTKLSGLPSWCPDFTVQSYLSLSGTDHHNRYNATRVPARRAATSASLFTVKIDGMDSILSLHRTRIVGRVVHVCDEPEVPESPEGDNFTAWVLSQFALHIKWEELLLSSAEHSGQPPSDQFSDREALFQALLAGRASEQQAWKPIARDDFKAYMLLFLMGLSALIEYLAFEGGASEAQEARVYFEMRKVWYSDAERFPELLPTQNEVDEHRTLQANCANAFEPDPDDLDKIFKSNSSLEAFVHARDRHLTNRKLFATDKGRLGLGPKDVKEGDEVLLVDGARVLFVIRKLNGGNVHQLVGETYLHGAMDGELMDDIETGDWASINLV